MKGLKSFFNGGKGSEKGWCEWYRKSKLVLMVVIIKNLNNCIVGNYKKLIRDFFEYFGLNS